MRRIIGLLIFSALACAWPASGEEAAVAQEFKELRALIEKQSKQIDVLAEQMARMRQMLEGKAEPGGAPPPPAEATAAAAVGAAPAAGTSVKPEFSTDAPKAEPADGKRHVVVKGETLTSIAKLYSITITDLKKANKVVDERKIQIGQSLTIPTSKTAEAVASEKKETP